MIKNIKQFKSTILGTVLMVVASYVLITVVNPNVYLVGGLYIAGILLWFAPDKLINIIEQSITEYFKKGGE